MTLTETYGEIKNLPTQTLKALKRDLYWELENNELDEQTFDERESELGQIVNELDQRKGTK